MKNIVEKIYIIRLGVAYVFFSLENSSDVSLRRSLPIYCEKFKSFIKKLEKSLYTFEK